jgi:hypothetical protein
MWRGAKRIRLTATDMDPCDLKSARSVPLRNGKDGIIEYRQRISNFLPFLLFLNGIRQLKMVVVVGQWWIKPTIGSDRVEDEL